MKFRSILPCLLILHIALPNSNLFSAGNDTAGSKRDVFAFKNANVLTPSGTFSSGATILIENGFIREVGRNVKIPKGARVEDLRGAYVLPGFVAAYSTLSWEETEAPNTIYPEKLALDSFDFFGDWRRQLAEGTTCAYLSPSKERLVGGRGSIVRLGLKDPSKAVVLKEAALEAILTEASLNPPGVFEPEVYIEPTEPFPVEKKQLPTARASQILELRKFLQSSHPVAQAVRSGKLPLRIRADTAREIRMALEVARQFKIRPIIVGGREAGLVVGEIKRRGACVVWLCPFDPERSSFLDPGKIGLEPWILFDTPRRLAEAGVPTAISTESGDGRHLLAAAAFAASHGMPKEKALCAITSEAARILGIEDRAGMIAKGRPADLVLFDGYPLKAGAKVLRTLVSGKVLYQGKKASEGPREGDLLLKNALVLTGDGGRFPDTDILIRGGRIVQVASGIKVSDKIPTLNLEGKVVAPGLIDISSRLGLHSVDPEQENVPSFAGRETFLLSVSTILDPQDPVFRACLREGILGLLVRGGGDSVISGTGAFVLPGRKGKSFVGLPFACIDVDVSGTSRLSRLRSLRSILRKLEKYENTWKEYREALREYRHRKPRDVENRLKEPAPPQRDPMLDRLLEARKRAIPLFVKAQRGDEIELALKLLADEGGYECALVDPWGIEHVKNVARMCRGVIVTPPYRRKVEGKWIDLPILLAKRDIPFALATDGAESTYYLRFYASEQVRQGLSADVALRALTSVPARLLGVSHRFGIIAEGRIADLVVYDGEVFDAGTKVVMVFAQGRQVYKRP